MQTTISSDDPQAIEKLKMKLLLLLSNQQALKDIKKLLKSGKGLEDPEVKASRYYEDLQHTLKFYGRASIPDYIGSNLSQNIRQVKTRIEQLEKLKDRPKQEEPQSFGSIQYIENTELNRVQLIFPDKPTEEIRKELKSYGFKWSPTQNAWQRQLNNTSIYQAKRLAAKYGA